MSFSVDAPQVLVTFRHQSECGQGLGWAKDLSAAMLWMLSRENKALGPLGWAGSMLRRA